MAAEHVCFSYSIGSIACLLLLSLCHNLIPSLHQVTWAHLVHPLEMVPTVKIPTFLKILLSLVHRQPQSLMTFFLALIMGDCIFLYLPSSEIYPWGHTGLLGKCSYSLCCCIRCESADLREEDEILLLFSCFPLTSFFHLSWIQQVLLWPTLGKLVLGFMDRNSHLSLVTFSSLANLLYFCNPSMPWFLF